MKLFLFMLLLGQTAATIDVTRPTDGNPSRILVSGGVSGTWLAVERANKFLPDSRGFDPSYTYLISDFKPMVKRLKNGKYLIQFTCDICEGLP